MSGSEDGCGRAGDDVPLASARPEIQDAPLLAGSECEEVAHGPNGTVSDEPAQELVYPVLSLMGSRISLRGEMTEEAWHESEDVRLTCCSSASTGRGYGQPP